MKMPNHKLEILLFSRNCQRLATYPSASLTTSKYPLTFRIQIINRAISFKWLLFLACTMIFRHKKICLWSFIFLDFDTTYLLIEKCMSFCCIIHKTIIKEVLSFLKCTFIGVRFNFRKTIKAFKILRLFLRCFLNRLMGLRLFDQLNYWSFLYGTNKNTGLFIEYFFGRLCILKWNWRIRVVAVISIKRMLTFRSFCTSQGSLITWDGHQ